MLLKVGDFMADSHGAESGFSSNVWVGAGKDGLDIRKQIARHFDRGDVAESAEGEADDVLVRVLEVTRYMSARAVVDSEDGANTWTKSL